MGCWFVSAALGDLVESVSFEVKYLAAVAHPADREDAWMWDDSRIASTDRRLSESQNDK